LRAYKLDLWIQGERSAKIALGYYVTRARLEAHRAADAVIEQELKYLEQRLIELHKRQTKLQEELRVLLEKAL
jgi:hypothetical protein